MGTLDNPGLGNSPEKRGQPPKLELIKGGLGEPDPLTESPQVTEKVITFPGRKDVESDEFAAQEETTQDTSSLKTELRVYTGEGQDPLSFRRLQPGYREIYKLQEGSRQDMRIVVTSILEKYFPAITPKMHDEGVRPFPTILGKKSLEQQPKHTVLLGLKKSLAKFRKNSGGSQRD